MAPRQLIRRRHGLVLSHAVPALELVVLHVNDHAEVADAAVVETTGLVEHAETEGLAVGGGLDKVQGAWGE